MKRLMPRVLVVLTILVVLGVGGYAGQVWWARRIASDYMVSRGPFVVSRNVIHGELLQARFEDWKHPNPWRGWGPYTECHFGDEGVMVSVPTFLRGRVWNEYFKLMTGVDLGDDPSAWETWFKAHPNLVWDPKQKRLVESKP